MLQVYVTSDAGLTLAPDPKAALESKAFAWADVCAPGDSEAMRDAEEAIEAALGVDVPTPLERIAFEQSARFYEERGALFLTATLMGQRSEGAFVADAVTFILIENRLVTVRTIRPRAFAIGEGRASLRLTKLMGGGDVLIALLEGLVERIADVLQESTRQMTQLSSEVFVLADRSDLRKVLVTLGRVGTLVALCHESLSSLQRLSSFATGVCAKHDLPPERFAAFSSDVQELERQANALMGQAAFLMQAALGLVGAEQNDVLRAVALATIAFAPATLIASIFGMNFEAMDWFKTTWGPWAAGAMMIAGPLALFAVARWRRWF